MIAVLLICLFVVGVCIGADAIVEREGKSLSDLLYTICINCFLSYIVIMAVYALVVFVLSMRF